MPQGEMRGFNPESKPRIKSREVKPLKERMKEFGRALVLPLAAMGALGSEGGCVPHHETGPQKESAGRTVEHTNGGFTKYDAQGNCIARKDIFPDGSVWEEENTLKDGRKENSKEKRTDKDGNVRIFETNYVDGGLDGVTKDESGNVLEKSEERHFDGWPGSGRRTFISRDGSGNVLENVEERRNVDGSITTIRKDALGRIEEQTENFNKGGYRITKYDIKTGKPWRTEEVGASMNIGAGISIEMHQVSDPTRADKFEDSYYVVHKAESKKN